MSDNLSIYNSSSGFTFVLNNSSSGVTFVLNNLFNILVKEVFVKGSCKSKYNINFAGYCISLGFNNFMCSYIFLNIGNISGLS